MWSQPFHHSNIPYFSLAFLKAQLSKLTNRPNLIIVHLWISVNQFQFFLSAQSLNRGLPFHRLFPGGELFIVSQSYGAAAFGVLGAFPQVVGFDTLVQMICPATVQTSVRTAQYIGVIHLSHPQQSM